ncbi:MAG: superoxide dismutase [Candidatus Doudnabacteria bacterium RIFCSPLOWO2_02_FULL_42_9]|uniref:Superoxide dismutase n=1 Tax=Candidatus Doudnabacteria bacterium RIFCSPHIGHO2_01_FULL_41_86 TaxID=1817821 RepID=A0A1F5N7U1_9BACT|nr:MAG: superoxide dismutase [Candidatus Doudnabacteria bacterium RIFCSPHIGHO2_01_FULL_41_86]OGE74963.1 MAG: superoxide dismutase [Candidatus Doudnabacteria bacterium RIFCSPHIGHO2_01_43_10]OGE85618.1 MAG: superoxide dismutase [Candidatus Doudnabacteria bacterium RIFCSPHIGHO2_12_FULL_42_22]OGE86555.1 MAG: superoxide dismutase [Candidatus Doudnabacteria bacterium RIFCSPHIGHO2_02_FULL_42_25]OGE91972.1 MAG: superoxide dismutase [Candidatus Doudnabacteria bacterium RIFCSPLOWO2_01_FULL_42_60]OGE9828
MIHQLPKLNYVYDALEPYIDAKTMELHHTKHHQTYVDKLNATLEKYPELVGRPLEELLINLQSLKVDDADRTAIRNHGGGHFNHSLFWMYLDPSNTKNELLAKEISKTFGSIDEFKKQFTDSAAKLFGSGWTWLARNNQNSKLEIKNLPNQDAPIISGLQPLLGLDVWEHAYYLKYQNRRPEYIENFWKVIKLI